MLTGVVETFRRMWRVAVAVAGSPVARELGFVGEWARGVEGYI